MQYGEPANEFRQPPGLAAPAWPAQETVAFALAPDPLPTVWSMRALESLTAIVDLAVQIAIVGQTYPCLAGAFASNAERF